MKRYIIYCDESIKEGPYYSNFYGGALVDEIHFNEIINGLNDIKNEIGLNGEIKWTNVSAQTLEKYKIFMNKYFEYIKYNKIKIRIMFKQGYFKTVGLTEEQVKNEFYILYYQFFKNAFGIKYCNEDKEDILLRIYFDKLPNKREQNENFKKYIHELQNVDEFYWNKIKIPKEDITDVDSKNHVILQGMDVILGAMKFRLNNEHLVKKEGSRRRGKKTIAKEKLYEQIRSNIVDMYPNFNIGVSTGQKGNIKNFWLHRYRHWLFVSSNYEIDKSKAKNK